jgi:glycosyl transferase family 1
VPLRILYVTTPRYDFTTATLVQGLNSIPGIELRTTTLGNYALPWQVLPRSDAIDFGRTASLLILGYNRGVDAALFWSIDNPRAARIFVDGGDSGELAISIAQVRRLDLVFKREYFRQDHSLHNLSTLVRRHPPGMWGTMRRHALQPFPSFASYANSTRPIDFLRNLAVVPLTRKFYPFPYGIEQRFRQSINPNPTIELSCMLGGALPEREEFKGQLQSFNLPNAFIGALPGGPADVQRLIDLGAVNRAAMREQELTHNPRYYETLRNSRRCISVPGGGFDTLRFWEILGAGSLLISKRIAIEMPYPLVEGKHYLAFDSLQELRDVLVSSYMRRDEADEIRSRAHEFALQFHSSTARAEYVLQTLASHRLIDPRDLTTSSRPST